MMGVARTALVGGSDGTERSSTQGFAVTRADAGNFQFSIAYSQHPLLFVNSVPSQH
jgi:hypothetical protein